MKDYKTDILNLAKTVSPYAFCCAKAMFSTEIYQVETFETQSGCSHPKGHHYGRGADCLNILGK